VKVFLPVVANGKQDTLLCATYNIGFDGGDWVMASQERVERIKDHLQDVDVIALQEVGYRGARQEVTVFMQGLNVYWEPHNENNHYCNMLVSKHPFVEGSQRTHTIFSRNGRNDRVNVSVQVRTPAGVVRVWSIHTRFEEPDDGTRQTLQGVKLVAESEPGVPFVVAGDYNTSRKNVLNIAKDVGLPVRSTQAGRIDHILVSGLEILEEYIFTPQDLPTSHVPVFARVTL
jgi:endonuclease/exonuclease/phosphatase family metal-dependent hydrolase